MNATESMVAISGNTYPVKDQLKSLGARWNADAKAWMVAPDKAGVLSKVENMQITIETLARIAGTTTERVRAQYAVNARQLQRMANHARKVGGEYRGLNAAQWQAKADEFKAKATCES